MREVGIKIKTVTQFHQNFILFLLSSPASVWTSTSGSQISYFHLAKIMTREVKELMESQTWKWKYKNPFPFFQFGKIPQRYYDLHHQGSYPHLIRRVKYCNWQSPSVSFRCIKGRGQFSKRKMGGTDMYVMEIFVNWRTTSVFLKAVPKSEFIPLRWRENICSHRNWESIKEFVSGRDSLFVSSISFINVI